MKLTLESTPELGHCNGVPVRIWTGTTGRGTPVAAFIVRVAAAADDGRSAAELAAEFVELTEAPTAHGVYGGPLEIAAPRTCTVCNARGREGRPAAFVATGADDGFVPPLPAPELGPPQWFECGDHGPTDNVAGVERVDLEPIGVWFARHAMPLPGDSPGLREALHRVTERKVAELASECRSLRVRLADATRDAASREPHWLIKDFHALYRAAAATMEVESVARTQETRSHLRAQLDRLKPAFSACDAERRAASGGQPS